MINGLHFRNLRGDLFGGLTAAVVALPLALAFGVTSGAGPVAGLYGAICVGFFAALFGGTPTQVSGPTGPMTVVMASIFTEFVALDPERGPWLAFTVVMLAGVFQICFGLLRLGKYITLVPFPVISGFMTGIGVIIILLQLGPLLGHASSSNVTSAVLELPILVATADLRALMLGSLTLTLIFCWPRVVGRWIPAPLAALLIGTLTYLLLFQNSGLAVIGEIPSALPTLSTPIWELALLPRMLTAALILAALGAIDSLLTSLVADNLSKTQHDSDRELIGQGVGNLVAGFFGGLPGAGATVRTVVNIRAGGKTPLSGALHALILLILVVGAAPLAETIPHAVLAGILIKVGVDIIDWSFLRLVHRAPPFVVALMLMVLTLTVFVDLITAVGLGVFIANLYTVKRLSELQLAEVQLINGESELLSRHESQLLAQAKGRVLLYHLNGPISFGAAKAIQRKLADSQPHDTLLLDLSQVPYIDVSTAMAIEEMILDTQIAERDVYLVGVTPLVEDVLRRMKVLSLVEPTAIFQHRQDALERAIELLGVLACGCIED